MKITQEFKEFIMRGNVLDMAVGLIIGAAFTAIVTSLVNDVIMPFVSIFTGGIDFSDWCLTLGSGENAATLNYGAFIAAILNFLIVALVIFLIIKSINKMRRKHDQPEMDLTTKTCPYCASEIALSALRCPHCTSMLESEAATSEAPATGN